MTDIDVELLLRESILIYSFFYVYCSRFLSVIKKNEEEEEEEEKEEEHELHSHIH